MTYVLKYIGWIQNELMKCKLFLLLLEGDRTHSLSPPCNYTWKDKLYLGDWIVSPWYSLAVTEWSNDSKRLSPWYSCLSANLEHSWMLNHFTQLSNLLFFVLRQLKLLIQLLHLLLEMMDFLLSLYYSELYLLEWVVDDIRWNFLVLLIL